jgi:hypothetical protein
LHPVDGFRLPAWSIKMKYRGHQSDPVARCASKRREPDRLSWLTADSAPGRPLRLAQEFLKPGLFPEGLEIRPKAEAQRYL